MSGSRDAPGQGGVDVMRRALLVRDVLDAQLVSRDGVRLARVADVDLEVGDRGEVRVAALVIGPQALARRLPRVIAPVVSRLVGDRYDHRIGIGEVVEVGPWLRLHGAAADYDVGEGDSWWARHLLRFLPGSGSEAGAERRTRGRLR